MAQLLPEYRVVQATHANPRAIFAKAIIKGMLLHTDHSYPEYLERTPEHLRDTTRTINGINTVEAAAKRRVLNLALATGVVLKATGISDTKYLEAVRLLENVAEVEGKINVRIRDIIFMLGMPDIGYEPIDDEKKYLGFKRGQMLLAKSFPTGNTNSWNQTYKKLALCCTPALFLGKTSPSSTFHKKNLPRFNMWLAGEPMQNIATETSSNLGALHVWEASLPKRFRKRVSYVDLVRTTDSLYWAINPDSSDATPKL